MSEKIAASPRRRIGADQTRHSFYISSCVKLPALTAVLPMAFPGEEEGNRPAYVLCGLSIPTCTISYLNIQLETLIRILKYNSKKLIQNILLLQIQEDFGAIHPGW